MFTTPRVRVAGPGWPPAKGLAPERSKHKEAYSAGVSPRTDCLTTDLSPSPAGLLHVGEGPGEGDAPWRRGRIFSTACTAASTPPLSCRVTAIMWRWRRTRRSRYTRTLDRAPQGGRGTPAWADQADRVRSLLFRAAATNSPLRRLNASMRLRDSAGASFARSGRSLFSSLTFWTRLAMYALQCGPLFV